MSLANLKSIGIEKKFYTFLQGLKLNKKRVFGYGAVGLISLIVSFNRVTDNLSEPGMGIWSSLISITSGILICFAAVLFIIMALSGIPAFSDRFIKYHSHKTRFLHAYLAIPLFIATVLVANYIDNRKDDIQAKALGFTSASDFRDAKKNNIFTMQEYVVLLAKREVKRREFAQRHKMDSVPLKISLIIAILMQTRVKY